MVDNTRHPKYYPYVTPGRPPVDYFINGRSEADVAYPIFNTGISRPIYDLNGNIARQLPLDQWPQSNTYHYEAFLMEARKKDNIYMTACRIPK
jgi:hypothetical protein